MIIGFDVDGQFVTRRDDERVVNRSVNYLELCFNFKDTETWDDLTKRVLFKGNGETYSKQLDNENKVVVPSEVLTGDSFVLKLEVCTSISLIYFFPIPTLPLNPINHLFVSL